MNGVAWPNEPEPPGGPTGTTGRGHCLCEAVRFEIVGPLRPVIYCHCQMCRRWSGHLVAATACKLEQLRLLSGALLRWYQSSPKARRGFCRIAGPVFSGNRPVATTWRSWRERWTRQPALVPVSTSSSRKLALLPDPGPASPQTRLQEPVSSEIAEARNVGLSNRGNCDAVEKLSLGKRIGRDEGLGLRPVLCIEHVHTAAEVAAVFVRLGATEDELLRCNAKNSR